MQASTDDCQTVQQYISMLFDQLQPVSLDQQPNNRILFKQIADYGRKIIQLSQQSTFKYRQEHFISKNQAEKQIAVIYRLITGEEPSNGYDKMLKEIIEKLQWDRKSIWARPSLPESRLIMTPMDFKSEDRKQHVLQEEKTNTKPPRTKSKQGSSKVSTVKEALQIKGYFQNEENIIRQCYDKVAKLLQVNKVQVNSYAPEALKFSRMKNENTTEKIMDLVKNSTENHGNNINNLYHLVEVLHDNLQKRLKNQGTANSKLQAYFEEVKRMEEVYSYSISKILQNSASIKTLIKKDPSLCAKHIQNVEEISHKLYNLYPNSEYFQNISVAPRGITENKTYGVQVNFNKAHSERKTGTQTYRLQIRLFQLLDKFEKNMKFKKSIQIKQVQKLFDTLRQVLPSCKNMSAQDLSYQDEFRKILQIQDRKQKQMNDTSSKKYKKYEKRIQQLETNVEELKKELQTSGQQWQLEKKKLTKKLQHEHSEYKKVVGVKTHLEENISEMLKQIEDMRQTVRRQGNQQTYQRKQMEREREELIRNSEETTLKLSKNLQELKLQKERIYQERAVYRQKIQLTQKQLQQQRQLSAGLKLELQTVISEHHNLRSQIADMTVIYEQKIKEVEQMIENLRELQEIKSTQENIISQLRRFQENAKDKLIKQGNYIEENLTAINKLTQQNQQLKKQIQHWKEESKLTDSDLKALKEQVDKVSSAYIQSENLLENTKQELTQVTEQRQKLFKQKLKMSRVIQQFEGQIHSLRTRYQAVELAQRDMKDQYYQKCQQIIRLTKQVQQQKREILKNKKELSQERDSRANSEQQLRSLRMDLQTKRQVDSVQHGKRRLEVQNLRVELRRKTEQLQKQRESYEQKIGIMTQRMQDLQQSMGQKQLLSRLLQHHSQ